MRLGLHEGLFNIVLVLEFDLHILEFRIIGKGSLDLAENTGGNNFVFLVGGRFTHDYRGSAAYCPRQDDQNSRPYV